MKRCLRYHLCMGVMTALFLTAVIPWNLATAQSKVISNAALRYEIDAKRMGVDMFSEDALPRSREFKRIDSSYYVGWMFEGVYKYNHAADYNGFKNAAVPLEKALYLLERDYRNELKTRTSDIMTYFRVYNYHLDYTLTAYFLMICYSNMEEPEKTYALLRKVLSWRFQRDFYLDVYNHLAWTVHRNRFYTSEKYSFLKNSIDENEKLAHSYLDSAMWKLRRDMEINKTIFQPGYEQSDRLAIYHYKSILHSYAFQIDSAAHYYELMRKQKALPYNNYGTFKMICGDFREAARSYAKESEHIQQDKRLQEWVYYASILDIYAANPQRGAQLAHGMIQANGSTPGFGWYNIALARSLLYHGEFEKANKYIKKAEEFKELHIGTTLGQTHYDFSVQMLKLKYTLQQIASKKFEHKNWWYNPRVLAEIARLTADKYFRQFLIINQFAQNPERDRVIYKLFSSESTVAWDEIWLLIKDFSTQFFLEKFKKEQQTDPRTKIHRYFQYFIAKLYMEQGKYSEAEPLLEAILQNKDLDKDYEKLLIARILEAQAHAAEKANNKQLYQQKMVQLFQTYPQLIPFSNMAMPLRLQIMGVPPKGFRERLNTLHIEWDNENTSLPLVKLTFEKGEAKPKIVFEVLAADGKQIVPTQYLSLENIAESVVNFGYRLFQIGDWNHKS